MAERADLTPAEILARQRMLEEALAGQDADAELFGGLGPQKPVANNRDYEYGPIVPVPEDQQEYIFDPVLRDQLERGKAFQGVPLSVSQDRRMAENPIGTMATGIGSLLDRDRREVLMPAAQEFGPSRQEFNPANNQFENRTTETIRPGVYRNPETMPGMSGTPIYQGLDAASSLISDTAARRRGLKDSAQARSQAAEIIPQIPQMLVDQADVSMEAGLRGERVVNEQNMSGTPFDVFAAPIGALGAGRVAMDIPEGRSFGIFASGKGASGQQAEDTVSMLEDAGLSPAEGWERQSGANTFKAYRSSLDNKVRYEIPMQNAKFASIVKKTEDPDVELGKALDPETRTEQRLLDMQKLRVTTNQFDDKEYLGVPASFDMNEKELNKYGFTTNAGVAAQGKYQLFPKPVLEQIMDFPELFDEYPQLRNLKIGPVGMFSFGVAGSYSPDEKMIRLGSVKNTGDGRREMMSTLLHEIQHAIQDIEGQYGGASPSMFTPDGFDEIRLTNIKARKVVDDNIEKGLSEIPVNVGGIRDTLTKVFKLKQSDSLASSKNNRLDGIVTDKDWSSLRRRVARYANQRAEEANDRAAGKIDASQMGRDKAKKNLEEELIMRVRIMGRPLTPEEETKARTKSASYAFNYSGSDRDLIYINDALNKAGVKSPEEVTKKISESFDERVKELQPLLVEDKELSNISRQAYTQYSGNPGEVEARNTELRFKGVLGRDNFKSGVTQYRDADGELVRAEKTITPEELQRTFPEETQQMVLPEEGLIYSLSEGRKNNPSMSIDGPTDQLYAQGGPVQNFNQGGMVSPMNKPRITQGLTNLLNKYSTGPLAGAGNVSRGTPVQGFGMGGQVYSDGRYYSDDRVMRPGELSDPTGAYQGQDVPYDPQLDPYGFTYNTEFGYGGGGGEGGAGNTNFSDEYLNSFDLSAYNNTSADAVTPTPPVPLATTNTSTNTSTNTGPFTPAYTEPAVVETPINFEDNPVLSVPVVAPAATTPVEPVPVAPTPVAATPAAATPVAAAPVAASQPIPNPITYPTAPVEAAVAPPNYFVPEEERVETLLPPSVYNPPAPPTESVYTPPAATVVDTPATLFTPPPVVAVPEAKPYNYLQELRPNFDISDVIKTQTGGYAPTQGMVINPTQYQYSPDQVMADNVYVPEIYQSLPQLDLSTVDVEDLADTDAAEVGFDANTTIDYNDLNYGSGGFAPQRDDYLPGGSFHMPGTEITGQQQYNVAYQQYEADFATRNGYTLEELRQINDYRTNNGLPRLQDMDVNTESGMS